MNGIRSIRLQKNNQNLLDAAKLTCILSTIASQTFSEYSSKDLEKFLKHSFLTFLGCSCDVNYVCHIWCQLSKERNRCYRSNPTANVSHKFGILQYKNYGSMSTTKERQPNSTKSSASTYQQHNQLQGILSNNYKQQQGCQ